MQLSIRYTGGQRADSGAEDYERILQRSLEHFKHRMKHACLYVEDVNGPRGGVDKQCRFVIHLRRMPPIVIQDRDDCMKRLIHRVADRASYALSQKTDRRKSRSQRVPRSLYLDLASASEN